MCLDHYYDNKEHWLDTTKRLCDIGVTMPGGKYKIFYEYAPVQYPLLNIPLTNVFDKKPESIFNSVPYK
jgi:hypothetical protein